MSRKARIPKQVKLALFEILVTIYSIDDFNFIT